jgi:hypothetical protein
MDGLPVFFGWRRLGKILLELPKLQEFEREFSKPPG